MTVNIRPARSDDLGAVDALLARAYPRLLKADYPPSVLVTALPIISRAQPELLGCGTYYVAEEGLVILGAGGWTRDRSRHDLGHIRHVVTDDRALRRGIGRAILSHALETARKQGVAEMICWSTLTAEPFYAAMGFLSEGPMDVALQPGISFPAIRMRQRLS
ncbi:MAG: GNAT family N-acetyltransferase [Pseudomonadota bacterium]